MRSALRLPTVISVDYGVSGRDQGLYTDLGEQL
jgi:hypothetical protein